MTFFSQLGEQMILPKDVLIQSKETVEVPNSINATIGIATENKKAMELSSIKNIVANLNSSDYLPYSPTPGIMKLRLAWFDKIVRENKNINKDYLSLPTVTTGITQGIDIAAALFSDKNDALVLPHLFWQNYAQIYNIKLNNKIYKYELFNSDNSFSINNIENTLNSITENKISIILNYPNNPTGYTPSVEQFKKLAATLNDYAKNNKDKKIIVVCDDAYFGLFFEENHKNSTLNNIYSLADNDNCLIIKLDGITKEYYSWGLRVGFISYYTKDDNFRKIAMEKTQGYLRSTTSSPSNISQQIAYELLTREEVQEEKIDNDKIIEERYHILKEAILATSLNDLVEVLPFNSGYFFTIKMPKHINAHDFRLKFLTNYKVGVYSMDDYHVRIAFSALDKENILEIIENFKQCVLEF